MSVQKFGNFFKAFLMDYSTHGVIESLRRFALLRGWPKKTASDPALQKFRILVECYSRALSSLAAKNSFQWNISPPNSSWRQGRTESRIRTLNDTCHLSYLLMISSTRAQGSKHYWRSVHLG